MIEKFAERDSSALSLQVVATPISVEPQRVITPKASVIPEFPIPPSGNLPPEYTVPAADYKQPVDTFPDINPAKDTVSLPFKYDEADNLDEIYKYLLSTYSEHYIGKNNVQVNDIVLAQDPKEVMGFWKFNSMKYILRYGKKGGHNRKDLLKAIHYVILLMHLDTQLAASEKETT